MVNTHFNKSVFFLCFQDCWGCGAGSTAWVQEPSPLVVWADGQQAQKTVGAGRLAEGSRVIAGSHYSLKWGQPNCPTSVSHPVVTHENVFTMYLHFPSSSTSSPYLCPEMSEVIVSEFAATSPELWRL